MTAKITQEYILKKVVTFLDALKLPYMITGAIAVNYYGRPRLTHDVDIVIEIRAPEKEAIVKLFQGEFYISLEGIIEAIRHKSMFNAIHQKTGFKVDFWLVKDDEYDKLRFKRRKKKKIFDKMMYITTPEDLIIVKLNWYKEFGSEKHFTDALGIYEIQKGRLDIRYLKKWLSNLSTFDIWQKILKGARL
ncbi:MAG: hypothetical protein HY929_06615 [Euryarchaeota archaeon]|nr:hypothetical protein [Euryarchaeota archaeon]